MKGKYLLMAFAALVCLPGFAAVNCRDFGAKGDGQADDTEAIQKALDAAGQPVAAGQSDVYYASTPEIVFPPGRYKVSKPLKPGSYQWLRGDGGKAIIEQIDPAADIVVAHGYRNVFQGLAFIGGRTAIAIDTANADSSMPKITDCQFYNTSGPAVELKGASTLFSIQDCLFMSCDQVLVNYGDMTVFRNCWISTRKDTRDKAVFVNRGMLHLEDVLGVPFPNGSDLRWVDNYNTLRAVRVRFGGEGAGFTPVVNYAKFDSSYPVWPCSVTLEQCYVYALGNPQRQAAVYCEEIPNTIAITDCTGLIDMALVQLGPETAKPGYFDEARAHPSLFSFTFWGNVRDNTDRWPIPEMLKPFTTEVRAPAVPAP